jgi:hypothetical protein
MPTTILLISESLPISTQYSVTVPEPVAAVDVLADNAAPRFMSRETNRDCRRARARPDQWRAPSCHRAYRSTVGYQTSGRAADHPQSIGDEIKRGHQGRDQHRAQGHCQYHDWKEHRFTYVSSAKRIAEFAFLKAARRCAILEPVSGLPGPCIEKINTFFSSPPLLDLSIHLVVGADKPLLDNKIGSVPARNPLARDDVNPQ